MLLFYIRHGDPIYDPDTLTPMGRWQAEAVAKRLALYGVDQIFASTSERAIQTAQPTAELTGLPIRQLDFCNESHMGPDFRVTGADGVSRWAFAEPRLQKLFVSPEVSRLEEQWHTHPAFSGHTFARGIARVHEETDSFLELLGYAHDRQQRLYLPVQPNEARVALFAHQAFGMAFLSSLLDIPYPQFSVRFGMPHTGMTVIEFRQTQDFVIPKVLTLSNDSHLYREGLPTQYYKRIYF